MRASGMRKVNGALLLGIIRDQGPVSRAELARLSGLTKPTVSSQVADLMARGVVREEGAGAPDERGGKPPKLLRFHAGAGLLAAAEINSTLLRVWLADLDGKVLDSSIAPTRPETGADGVLDTLSGLLRETLARGRDRKQKLVAMAVAAPGRVDAEAGVVREAGNVFHWRDVAVLAKLERAFRVPVAVDNDVNLAALGEMHAGLAQGIRNFALIRLATGVGAGLVLDGRLYQGTHWAAGEIGHMVFGRFSGAEEERERGSLELAIGSDRVRERVKQARLEPPGAAQDLAALLREAVGRNDPVAQEVVEDVAAQLSLAVADLAAAIDPELIVLAGEMFDLVADPIRETVERVIPWPLRIERSALGEDAALMGAIGVARGVAHGLLCDLDRG
jgi:glucokinase